jgi:hypothetical protein
MRLRGALLLAVGVAAVAALPAHASIDGPDTPPPAGCAPTPLAQVGPSAGQVCVHRVLVTETWAAKDQNDSRFSFTDHDTTMTGYVPNWWPNGGPVAGMVVTLWGQVGADGQFAVDHWVDLTHGAGPAPTGPYPLIRLLDITSGKAPEDRMVWVRATPFALDPQDGGDGDIHVQTLENCPAGGLTTETTPAMRGYVDRPGVNLGASSTDTTDDPHNHLGDAPPIGVPVMILGETRYDFGFGWWEIHPIRAWRYLNEDEVAQAQAECAADPAPHVDPNGPAVAEQHVPIPFGFPPCTDGSEFGNLPGYAGCGAVCFVAHTAIGQPEQLAGPCDGVDPIVTPSQEALPESTPSDTTAGATPPVSSQPAAERVERLTVTQALARMYGRDCASARARSQAAFAACLNRRARRFETR